MKKKYIFFSIVVISLAILIILGYLFIKKENFDKKYVKNNLKLKDEENVTKSEKSDNPVDNANDKNMFGLQKVIKDADIEVISQLTEGVSDFIKVSGNQLFSKLFLHKNEISWRDLAINITIQSGIIALSITLTSLGLGFANPLLNLFSPYQKNENLPINYEKINSGVEDQFIKDKIILCNTTIQNTISFMNNVYLPSKLSSDTNCDINISTDYTFKCVKNNPDFNIVRPSYKVENKNKRVILKEMLGNGSPPYDLFYNSNYGINFIKNYYKTNTLCATQLFKAFITIINLEIGYFQELSLIDTTFEPVSENYINPWKSTYIGDVKRIGKFQLTSSLLGRLQQYCKDLFEIIRNMIKMYYSNLYWKLHCNEKNYYAGPDDETWADKSWISCAGRTKTYYMQDRNKVILETNWIEDLEIKENQVKLGTSEEVKFIKADENLKYIYINKFLFFLNDPYQQLQTIKKIAGIKWVENEKNYLDIDETTNLPNYFYDAASSAYEINFRNQTEYNEDGGFPFGTSSISYKKALLDMENTEENAFAIKTYPSPTIEFNMRKACSDLSPVIDGSIFDDNSSYAKYNQNMTCDGDFYLSSLLPGKSPGNTKTDNFIDKTRIAYCLDREDKVYPLKNQEQNCRKPDVVIAYDISEVILQIAKSQNAENIFKNQQYILILTGYNGKEEYIKNCISINSKGSSQYIIREDLNSLIAKYYFNNNELELNLEFKGNLMYDSINPNDPIKDGKINIDADYNMKPNFILDKTRNLICKKVILKENDPIIPKGFPEIYQLNTS